MSEFFANATSLPAPIDGWNTKDPLSIMSPTYAIKLTNFFPDSGRVVLRKGYTQHQTGVSGGVQTLANFIDATGTEKFIACSPTNIYDVTTLGAAPSSLGGGFSSGKWQTIQFRATGNSRLIMVNGVDAPQHYTGSILDAGARPFYTGITETKLIHVTSYRNRLYFIEKDSTSIWYGGTNANKGALTELNVGALLQYGGYLMWASPWTRQTAEGVAVYFVLCSSQGEILIYTGSDPSTWTLSMHLFLPKPVGRRSYFNINNELYAITVQGVLPISEALSTVKEPGQYGFLTDKIQDQFATAASCYADCFGWQAQVFPNGHKVYINIPSTSAASASQYVMNTLTGAWTNFTGMNAQCWGLYAGNPYFGDSSGVIYRADYGDSDNGTYINVEVKQAFNYLGDQSSTKFITMAKPIFLANGTISVYFDLDADFNDTQSTNTIVNSETGGSYWDEDDWDVAEWDPNTRYVGDWYSVSAIGKCVAIKMKASFKSVTLEWSSTELIAEPGGLL